MGSDLRKLRPSFSRQADENQHGNLVTTRVYSLVMPTADVVTTLITQRNSETEVVTIWLARDSTVVGSVEVRPRRLTYGRESTIRYVEIVGLNVDPVLRRRGFGSKLVRAATEWAREQGFEYISVESTANPDKPGPPFYEALGFTRRSIIWDLPVGSGDRD